MDINDIPSDDGIDNNETYDSPDELSFSSESDFKKLRSRMLNALYMQLEIEPSAQIIKQARDILGEIGLELLDTDKSESEVLSIVRDKSDDEFLDDIANM